MYILGNAARNTLRSDGSRKFTFDGRWEISGPSLGHANLDQVNVYSRMRSPRLGERKRILRAIETPLLPVDSDNRAELAPLCAL